VLREVMPDPRVVCDRRPTASGRARRPLGRWQLEPKPQPRCRPPDGPFGPLDPESLRVGQYCDSFIDDCIVRAAECGHDPVKAETDV